MFNIRIHISKEPINHGVAVLLRFVLFGFITKLASHLERSPLIHSLGYESAGDRPTCLATLPLKSKSFVQYPGWRYYPITVAGAVPDLPCLLGNGAPVSRLSLVESTRCSSVPRSLNRIQVQYHRPAVCTPACHLRAVPRLNQSQQAMSDKSVSRT